MKETLSVIKKIDKKHWSSCYKGLGEGVITRIFNIMEGDFNSGRDKNIIANGSIFVADLFKPYFFQGVGEGLAKQFAQPYHGYITEEGFYDEEILRSYKALIDDKYKNDFLAGFHNNDVWSDF